VLTNNGAREQVMRSGRFAARRYRKFSTSMSSVVWRSTCGYKIHRPSGETVNPTAAGLSVVKIGMALLVAKLKNWMEEPAALATGLDEEVMPTGGVGGKYIPESKTAKEVK
jgi:hypothetical protein